MKTLLLLVSLIPILIGCGRGDYLCGAVIEYRDDGIYKFSKYTEKWVKLADGTYGNSQCTFSVIDGKITKVTNIMIRNGSLTRERTSRR